MPLSLFISIPWKSAWEDGLFWKATPLPDVRGVLPLTLFKLLRWASELYWVVFWQIRLPLDDMYIMNSSLLMLFFNLYEEEWERDFNIRISQTFFFRFFSIQEIKPVEVFKFRISIAARKIKVTVRREKRRKRQRFVVDSFYRHRQWIYFQ